MLAERFTRSELDAMVRIAGAVADTPADSELSTPDRELTARARTEVAAHGAGRRSPAVTALRGARHGEPIWLLRVWNTDMDSVTPYSTYAGALAELGAQVRAGWDKLRGRPGVPAQPPVGDAEAVQLYYGQDGSKQPGEGYELTSAKVIRPRRTRMVPLDFTFPSAVEAEALNRQTAFEPANEYGPAFIEVAGVLTFAYLDATDGCLCISVHLDTAGVARPDGTVPLRVTVEDDVILDDSTDLAPHPTVLEELLASADAMQRATIHEVAVSAGLMWSCPRCRWANPAAASCCESKSECRAPKPPRDSFLSADLRDRGRVAMTSDSYPPAPQHLRAASAHACGHLRTWGRRATLQVYLNDGLVYRNDGDGYRLPPETAQADSGGGPYIITAHGRRAILNSTQRAAIDSADEHGALAPETGRATAAALVRLGLVEYRDARGDIQPTGNGRPGPLHRLWLTPAGVAAAGAAPSKS